MILQECYRQNAGEAILIPGGGKGNNGQCVQWADTVLHDVYGFPYIYTPAAIDWWDNADALGLTQNFDKITDGSIKIGDFVVFGAGVGSQFGHIDVAATDGSVPSFTGYDSNWGGKAFYNSDGYPVLHTVVHNDKYNQFILGSLRRKGSDMPDTPNGVPNDGDIMNAKRSSTGVNTYQPTGPEFDYFKDPEHGFKDLMYDTISGMQVQINNLNKALKDQSGYTYTPVTEQLYRRAKP